MRIWSLHPQYLDARGLAAAWREGLLAQAVLLGRTRGYRRHPQLERFRRQPSPPAAIAAYLHGVHAESVVRGHRFDADRIDGPGAAGPIPVTRGQVAYEWRHLLAKLRVRDPARAARLQTVTSPVTHPLFRIVPGAIEPWERAVADAVPTSVVSRDA